MLSVTRSANPWPRTTTGGGEVAPSGSQSSPRQVFPPVHGNATGTTVLATVSFGIGRECAATWLVEGGDTPGAYGPADAAGASPTARPRPRATAHERDDTAPPQVVTP